MKQLARADYAEAAAVSIAGLPAERQWRAGLRARLCPPALFGSDVVAFALAATLAFVVKFAAPTPPLERALENVSQLGSAWHGWGTLLVVVSLLCWFSSRGHYTSRVPFWTQAGDAAVGTAVALACDTFITIAVYGRPVTLELLLRWVLYAPCLMVLRAATREALNLAMLWSIDTLVIAGASVMEEAKAALSSERTLGYRVVGSIDVDTVADLGEDALLELIEERGAEFVVVTVSGDRPAEHSVLAALRHARLPLAVVPSLDGLPVVGFRQHYFFGHDIVMLVSRNDLARPFSRMLKTGFDQLVAGMLVLLLAPLLCALALIVRADGGPALYRQPADRCGRTQLCMHQVPHDGGQRRSGVEPAGQHRHGGRGGMGCHAEAAQRSAGHPDRPFPPPVQPGRTAATAERAAR